MADKGLIKFTNDKKLNQSWLDGRWKKVEEFYVKFEKRHSEKHSRKDVVFCILEESFLEETAPFIL